MSNIPRDAREVYLNERGEPIAFCPKESLGLTDLARADFYALQEVRMQRLLARAREKGSGGDGLGFVAVCIDVDDPAWTWLADTLMPGHNWNQYRDRGERPCARGVVPRGLVVEAAGQLYPAALPAPVGPFVAVFAAGGITFVGEEAPNG